MNEEEGAAQGEEKPRKAFPVLKTKYGSDVGSAAKKPPPRQLKRTKGEGGGNGLRADVLRMHRNLNDKWNPKNAAAAVPRNTKILREEIEAQALMLAYDALANTSPTSPSAFLSSSVPSSPSCDQICYIRNAVAALLDNPALEIQTEVAGEKRLNYVELSTLEKMVTQIVDDFKPTSTPSIRKTFSFNYSIAASTDKGVRATNEDYFLVIEHYNELLGLAGDPQVYIGLYDGHSGKYAAEYCRTHLHVNIGRQEEFQHDVGQAMVKAFQETDQRYNDTAARLGVNDGTTAMAVLLREDSIVVANCGDARGFLFRGADCEPISLCSFQHPDREDEKDRVKRAGGAVVWYGAWRVNGVLAISRSIGDPDLRTIVVAEPEVQCSPLSPGQDDFFVLATDGLWDVMEPSSVASFVRSAVASSQGPEGIAQGLVNEAVNTRNSKDNVTVVVIFLHWNTN